MNTLNEEKKLTRQIILIGTLAAVVCLLLAWSAYKAGFTLLCGFNVFLGVTAVCSIFYNLNFKEAK